MISGPWSQQPPPAHESPRFLLLHGTSKRKEPGHFISDISAGDRKDIVGLLQLSIFSVINVTLKIASHKEGFRHIGGPWEQGPQY